MTLGFEFIEVILKYITVIGASMVKFAFGPAMSIMMKFTLVESIFLTIVGMMATTLIITFLGSEYRTKILNWLYKNKKRRIFSPKNRKIVKVWRKYGLSGIAFLTPLLLSPIGGALVAVSFGEKRNKILTYMLSSACFWSIILNIIFYFAGDKLGLLPTEI